MSPSATLEVGLVIILLECTVRMLPLQNWVSHLIKNERLKVLCSDRSVLRVNDHANSRMIYVVRILYRKYTVLAIRTCNGYRDNRITSTTKEDSLCMDAALTVTSSYRKGDPPR